MLMETLCTIIMGSIFKTSTNNSSGLIALPDGTFKTNDGRILKRQLVAMVK